MILSIHPPRRLIATFILIGLILPAMLAGVLLSNEFESGIKDIQTFPAIREQTLEEGESFQLKPALQASADPSPSRYERETTFLSPVRSGDFPFTAVALEWEEKAPPRTQSQLSIRFKEERKVAWTPWQAMERDIDFKEGENLGRATAFINTNSATAFQYKIAMKSGDGASTPRIRKLQFHLIDAAGNNAKAQAGDSGNLLKRTSLSRISGERTSQTGRRNGASLSRLIFGDQNLTVIPRASWGADERYRLSSYFGYEEDQTPAEGAQPVAQEAEDLEKNGEVSLRQQYPEEFELTRTVYKNEDGENLYWPIETAKNIQKIIIHHTASTPDLEDPASAVRAIYYYHAVRRGWGDIGYNYIIDPLGNIYEGRAGGEGGVGGHAQGYNTGSIGIAVIGNYQNSDVPYPVLEALSALIENKADRYGIDVDGVSRFRGEVMADVLGHRDVGATLCPGQKLYDTLPTLKKLIAHSLENSEAFRAGEVSSEPFAFASVNEYAPIVLDPEKTRSFELKLKNTGQNTWDASTYLVANRNAQADGLVHINREVDNPTSIANMEETEVKPGEIATFHISAESSLRSGFQSFDLTPIFNGTKKTNHYIDLPVYVSAPTLSYDVEKVDLPEGRVKNGAILTGEVRLRNTSNVSWYGDGAFVTKLGTAEPDNRASAFLKRGENRFAVLKEGKVAPGEIGTFVFTVIAPKTPGRYVEAIQPLVEGLDRMSGEPLSFEVMVYNPNTQAILKGQSAVGSWKPGETRSVWIELENGGESTWRREGTKRFTLGITKSALIRVTKAKMNKSKVKPGQTVRLTFSLTAPRKAGNYVVYFRPRAGRQNLMQKPITIRFQVKAAGNISGEASSGESALDQETIRVKLDYDAIVNPEPSITGNGDFRLYLGEENFLEIPAGNKEEVRRVRDRYRISYDARTWEVEDIPRFAPNSASTVLEIANYEKHPAWNPALNDNEFRGVLEVRDVDGTLVIINELPMEMYLRGIAEVSNGDPTEKIRTMMILARTYARYYLTSAEKFPGKPYHLSDDPDESQKYLGYGFEKRAPNIARAVTDTAGLVVTYQGKLVKTPYFTGTDGTATKSAEEVWGWKDTPYLVSVPDPLCESDTFHGHGVGLSGCGATAAAKLGRTYEEIIKYYYHGVEIDKLVSS